MTEEIGCPYKPRHVTSFMQHHYSPIDPSRSTGTSFGYSRPWLQRADPLTIHILSLSCEPINVTYVHSDNVTNVTYRILNK